MLVCSPSGKMRLQLARKEMNNNSSELPLQLDYSLHNLLTELAFLIASFAASAEQRRVI